MSYDQKQQQKKDKKETAKIFVEKAEMGTTFSTKLTSSEQLAKMISKVFAQVSPDFEGTIISLNPRNGRIMGELSFSDNPSVDENNIPEGKFKVIQSINSVTGSARPAAIFNNFNKRNKTSKCFELTDTAKEAFGEFIPQLNTKDRVCRTRDGKINWEEAYREDIERTMYGHQSKIYSIIPFDIEYFLSKIYGNKAPNGGYYTYATQYIRPIAPIGQYPNGNMMPVNNIKFLLAIFKLENDNITRMCAEAGVSVMQNNLNIIR